MIVLIVGGLGSGKTITAVREIIKNNIYAYTNIVLKNYKPWHRLMYKDILVYDEKKRAIGVNWDFWENVIKERKDFSIIIDELHNIIHSRTFMKKENIYMAQFVSQVRKVLYDKPNNHLMLISQDAHKVEIDVRELASIIIKCECKLVKGETIIINKYFEGLENYENGISVDPDRWFNGNPYFKYFDTIQFLKFNPDGWL